MKRILSASLAAFVSSLILLACSGGNGSAASGLTQQQVQALIDAAVQPLQAEIATLQTQVKTLQSNQPAVFITSPNAPKTVQASTSTTAAAATCTGLGTLTGRPTTSDPMTSSMISGVSCTGYYFTVIGAPNSSSQAVVQPLPSPIALVFTTSDCTGQAYIDDGSNYTLSVYKTGDADAANGFIANGGVFRYWTSNFDPTIASSYYMLPAGEKSQTISPMSFAYFNGGSTQLNNVFTCQQLNTNGATYGGFYPVKQNDPTVTGIPNGPIQGPVKIG